MTSPQTEKTKKQRHTLDDAMGALFSLLDEGIDDMEQGRLISSEDFWAEFDALDE